MENSFLKRLMQPADGASLAFLRISYGLIMAIDIMRLYLKGNLTTYYFIPKMEFNYHFAPWVGHFPDHIMVGLYCFGFILSICFMLGYRFKVTGILFILIQIYFFLTNPLNYLNHIYLAIILGFLLWVTPAHKIWSLDSIRFRKKGTWKENDTIPRWPIYLLMIQIEIMLIYAGITKLTPAFLEGHSLREWLNYIYEYWLFSYEWQIRVAVFIAIATHLLMAPFLLFKKTRLFALVAYGFFHLSNHIMFSGIGIFPFLTFTATTIFLSPSWPRRCMASIQKWRNKIFKKPSVANSHENFCPIQKDYQNENFLYRKLSKPFLFFLCFWLCLQIVLPLRHFLIPGNVHWDRNGNMFSWQMMLISRRFGEGGGFYICADKPDKTKFCRKDFFEDSYLPLHAYVQIYMYPDLALQYAQQLKEEFLEQGYTDARVYGVARHSISGRPFQNYWNPDIDLTKIKRSLWKDNFILPLKGERPGIPPLDAKLNGKLKSEFGYWKEIYPNNDMQLEDNYHQMYPKEVFEYLTENRKSQ